jgi:hypothetical protein
MPWFFVDLNTRNGSANIGSILLKDIVTRDDRDRIVSGVDIYPYYLIVSSVNVYSVLELKYMYTQCGPKALGLIFFIEDTRGRHIPFFKFKVRSIYRLLRGRTVSEKLPKIPLFGPSFIRQFRLLGPQQHPQSGGLLT